MKNSILIVDDDIQNIGLVRLVLEHEYNIFEAHNGIEAIQILTTLMPDLILLDWNMPKMNGFETLQYIKSNNQLKHIQIVMLTSRTEMDVLLEAFENGAVDFITKPFNQLELRARVSTLVQLANYHSNALMVKNNEIVAQSMKMYEQAEYFNNVFDQLESEIEGNCKEKLEKYKKEFQKRTTDISWKNFEDHFNLMQPNFFKNLILAHPDLSPAELKLSSLLRLNLSSKEISTIIFSSVESIKVSRSRLRKKLGIESESNLTGYLMQF